MQKIVSKFPLSLLVLLVICYLSFFKPSGSLGISTIPHLDKLVHGSMYFGLSATLWFDLFRFKIVQPCWGWTIAFILPCFIGGLFELIQAHYTTYRGGDWFDFLANCAGALLASLLMFFFFRIWFEKRNL